MWVFLNKFNISASKLFMVLELNGEYISICKHCGNKSTHLILLIVPMTARLEIIPNHYEDILHNNYIIQCQSCKRFTIADDFEFIITQDGYPKDIHDLSVSYPKDRKFFKS